MAVIFAVGAGGALGALLRYLTSGWIMRLTGSDFPFGTLCVNVLGSLLMGVLVGAFALKVTVSPEMRAFLTVGLLGGFTTFSAFSLETVLLIERGALINAGLYAAGSLLLGVLSLFAGIMAGKTIL